MKFKICIEDDYLVIEADTIKEIRRIAKAEVAKRGWKDYWSEEMVVRE